MKGKEVTYNEIVANNFNLSAKYYVQDEPIRVLFICNGLFSTSRTFLNECDRKGLLIRKVRPDLWRVENAEITFRIKSFKSIAGQRVDVLVNWTNDNDRLLVLSRSKHREWSKNIKYENGLLDMLCAMKNERLKTDK